MKVKTSVKAGFTRIEIKVEIKAVSALTPA